MTPTDTPTTNTTRQCSRCKDTMSLQTVKKDSPLFPFFHKEKSYQLYHCSKCNTEVTLSLANVMLIQCITALSIIIGSVFLWQSQLFRSFFQINILISLAITALCLLFFIGGIWNGFAFIKNIYLCYTHPPLHKKRTTPLYLLTLFLYSLTPFIYWGGMGYLNDYYFHINEDLAFFMILPGFAPFYFSAKFGFTPSTIFLLSASYPVIGLIIMWNT